MRYLLLVSKLIVSLFNKCVHFYKYNAVFVAGILATAFICNPIKAWATAPDTLVETVSGDIIVNADELLAGSDSVSANEPALEQDQNYMMQARNGVLQVQLIYIDEDGGKHQIKTGTGFLIGEPGAAEYIITSYDTVFVPDETRDSIGREYKVDKDKWSDITFVIQITIKRDVAVYGSVASYSEELGFAAVHLEQAIYDRTPLLLNTDLDDIKEMEAVYTMGYPTAIQGEQDISLLTSEDVSTMSGILSKKTQINGRWIVEHSAVVSEGNVGGPLIDGNGYVIGVNQVQSEDGYNYSVHISEVTSILDALGIPYTAVDHTVVEVVDTTTLRAALENARSISLKGYTTESIEAYHDALNRAELILMNPYITNEQVSEGLAAISQANGLLVIKSNMKMYLIFAGIIALFILVIIILVSFLLKKNGEGDEGKKKKKKKGEDAEPKPYEKIFENVKNTNIVQKDETSILNSAMGFNDGETTVLSLQAGAATAKLCRCSSGDEVTINKDQFYIGKDGLKSDYCIKGNPSISRTHALIKRVENNFFIEDLKATNGTHHNGVKLQPSQSVKLSDGDRLRFADEEFVFKILS